MEGSTESIIRELSTMKPTSNFSHVAQEIQSLRELGGSTMKQELDRINAAVDFLTLGFPEDFKLHGIDDSGRLLTVSGDGSRMQVRDSHLSVIKDVPNVDTFRKLGDDRQLLSHADGTSTYTVKSGDTLSSISRDVLENRLGRIPTGHEISDHYSAIAQLNGIKDPDSIHPGEEIQLPASDFTGSLPGVNPYSQPIPITEAIADFEKPGMSSDAIHTFDGVCNPVLPRGLEWGALKDDDVEKSTFVSELPGGRSMTSYSGTYNPSGWGNESSFTGYVERDARGMVTSSQISYPDETDVTFDIGGGKSQEIEYVRSVSSKFDSSSGRYVTEIVADGAKYMAYTDSRGVVQSFKQIE